MNKRIVLLLGMLLVLPASARGEDRVVRQISGDDLDPASLVAEPLGGGRDEKEPMPPVTGQILCRTPGLLVGRRGIQFQKCFGPGAELGLRLLCEGCRRGLFLGEGNLEASFVGIPSGQQRDVALLTAGIDGGDILGKEIAIDVRCKTEGAQL